MNTMLHGCACFTHGFTVQADDEVPLVFLTTWTYGTAGQRLDWRNRIRWCWRILRTGFPFHDEITLEAEAAEKLAQALMGAAADAGRGEGR